MHLFPSPESALADAAHGYLADVAPPWLVAHSHRTYQFGRGLLHKVGRDVDAEVLYVGSMLHDLALGTGVDDGVTPFHLRGAALARDFVLAEAEDAQAARLVHDAIALHLDLATADDPRPEVAGVHLGAALDVVGLRIDQVPEAFVEEALAAHPRMDLKARLIVCMRAEAERKPDSAVALLVDRLDFLGLISSAPFSS